MGIDLNDCSISRLPGDDDGNFGWSIVRASADGPRKFVVLSDDIFGIRTHFFRGRTGPHTNSHCDACEAGLIARWKGYLLVIEPSSKQQFLLEFTPPCAKNLDDARKEHGTMRGLQIVASRTGKRPNSKVIISVRGIVALGPSAVKDEPIWPILATIWGLMYDKVSGIALGSMDDLSEYEKSA